MNAESSTSGARIVQVILIVLGVVALYYLYNYLYGAGATGLSSVSLVSGQISGKTQHAVIVPDSKLPPIYTGGMCTVEFWFYVSDWNYRRNFPKSILSLAGPTTDAVRIYLGANKATLHVRVNSEAPPGDGPGQAGSQFSRKEEANFFSNMKVDSGLLDSLQPCDVGVELQRWNHVIVAIDGKTVDTYMNGKLARSCVLPGVFHVDASGLQQAALLQYGGFGGLLASATLYNSALSPDQVWRNYMAGPSAVTSVLGWFQSIFQPQTQL